MIGRALDGRFELLQHSIPHELFEVFRGVEGSTGRAVRVRLLKSAFAEDEDLVEEILAVGRRLEGIRHPALETTVAAGFDNGLPYIASEWSDGMPFADRLKRLNSLSVSVGLSAAIAVAEALQACHQAGIIHGDVSDRTVLARPGEGIKLMEAGYWRAYGMSAAAARQMVPLMAPYLAPEITSGDMPSPASDLYALGVLVYQILSGRHPYAGDSPNVIALKHHSAPYPSLREANRAVPEALDAAVERCLAKRPEQRWGSAAELAAQLRTHQDALRFGRPMTPAATSTAPAPAPREAAAPRRKLVPVSDSGSPPEPQADEPPSRRNKGNAPRALIFLVYGAGLLAVAVLGVWVSMLLQPPREIEAPDVVGQSIIKASKDLEEKNIAWKTVEERVSDSPADVILEQTPQAGSRMRGGEKLELVVSAGSEEVAVPDVVGDLLTNVQPKLEQLGFTVEVSEEAGSGKAAGEVLGQDPEPDAKAARSSVVRLRVASAANVIGGRSIRRLYTYLVDIPLDVPDLVDIRVTMLDALGEEVVLEDRVKPGYKATVSRDGFGSTVRFITRINGEVADETVKGPEDAEE